VPHYYNQSYQPQYIGTTTVVNQYVSYTKVINYNVPGAVTVVPTGEFGRVITRGIAQAAEAGWLARTRPVMDPFAMPRVRELAPTFEAARPRVGVPVEIQQAWGRALVTSQNPIVPAVTVNTVKAFKVQAVQEEEGKRRLKIEDNNETVAVTQPSGLPATPARVQARGYTTDQARQARIAQLSAQAAQGDKSARQEMRQVQEEQRAQDRTNRQAAAQQAAAEQAQQAEQRRAEKQAARQQAQEAASRQQQQQQSEKEQRRAARQQAARQGAEQQAAQQQAEKQRQQQKAERRAERQNAAAQQGAQQQERKKNKNEER
jgi:hypothetical protein